MDSSTQRLLFTCLLLAFMLIAMATYAIMSIAYGTGDPVIHPQPTPFPVR